MISDENFYHDTQIFFREFTREYTLPNDIDALRLSSSLSKDGVLQIEAPAPASVHAPREWLIPIEKL